MFHIIICDDDESYIDNLKEMIISAGMSSDEVLFYEYSSGEAFIENIDNQKQCDLLILDMQMKDYDGHETARMFREKFPKSMLVFCSGVRMPTDESFKTMPFRYLLKQYSQSKMLEELQAIIAEMRLKKDGLKIAATHYSNTVLIDPDDVIYIENYRYGSIIHVIQGENEYSGKITTEKKLPELMEELSEMGFEYAHNSYIVNLKYVIRLLTNGEIMLVNGECLNVSRSRLKKFRASFSSWISKKYK